MILCKIRYMLSGWNQACNLSWQLKHWQYSIEFWWGKYSLNLVPRMYTFVEFDPSWAYTYPLLGPSWGPLISEKCLMAAKTNKHSVTISNIIGYNVIKN